MDGIGCLARHGPVWRALSAGIPSAGTICNRAARWQAGGSAQAVHGQLRGQVRTMSGRTRVASAAILDSRSVTAAGEAARAGRGSGAATKAHGRTRHIAVDTIGLLLTVLITAASAQDRDAAKPLLRDLRRAFPPVTLTWAGGGSAHPCGPGPRSRSPSRSSGGPVTCTPSRCCPAARVAGRILAWITRHRRTVRDYQRLASHHETCLCRAMMIVMTRRLARTPGRAGTAAGPQVTGKPVREAT